MKSLIPLALAAFMLPGLILAQSGRIEEAIPEFKLKRYLGKWFEIARFDHRFERGLTNVTAEYNLRPDGKVQVINTGWKNGEKKVASQSKKNKKKLAASYSRTGESRTTLGDGELDFCVRNGNRYFFSSMATSKKL